MKKLLAVDGNSILNRAYYGIRPLTNSKGLFTHAVYGFINILTKHIEALEPDALAVAFDMKAPTFRHKRYAGYKATRKGMPEELAVQLPWAKKVVPALGGEVLTLEGWEADDILGTLSELGEDSAGEWEVYVLTGDRDSLQLIGPATTVLLATTGDTVVCDAAKFTEMYGIPCDRFVDLKALMGDSSDNIPGVAGVGEKTAVKLISEFVNLEGIYESIDSPSISRGVRTKLEAGKESAYLSRELARIDRHAPIAIELDALPTSGVRKSELYELCIELEFAGLIKRFALEPGNTDADTIAPVDKPIERIEVSADELLTKAGERAAIIVEENGIAISPDGDEVYFTACEDASELIRKLLDKKCELIVFDSKQIYNSCEIDGEFYYDVMLAAYVIDPSDAGYTPDRLKLKYLGISGENLEASELYKLYVETSRVIAEREQEKLLFEIEMPLSKVLSSMERLGFRVDIDGLASFSSKLAEAADELRDRIYMQAGEEFNVNSPKQLAEILFEKMGLPSGKKNHRGYSTSAEVLERLAPIAPIVQDILYYRQVTKLRSTYGEGLAKAADDHGFVHSSFNQTITATGRLSSTEPNLQNIPVRTELGRELRRFFVPSEPGRVLVDADYSQIELRLLAHISGDETMLDAFRNDIDVHSVTASQVFRVPIEQVTSELRKRAKAVNFGIVYGISDYSLAQDIGVSRKKAGEYIETYLANYPKIGHYLKSIIETARADGYVTTLFGRRRYIPELSSSKRALQAFGERVAMNSPIQGTAADVIKIAMINVDRALRASGLDAKLILQVHDELIVEASREDAEAVRELLVREMESAVELALPLTVSAEIGKTWYDCKD